MNCGAKVPKSFQNPRTLCGDCARWSKIPTAIESNSHNQPLGSRPPNRGRESGTHPMTLERVQADKDGLIRVPDRPGLGITLNEEFVKRYLIAESR